MFSPSQVVGFGGEEWVFGKLQDKGYDPHWSEWDADCCDMTVRGLPVEVKFARPTSRLIKSGQGRKPYRRWQWFIHPTSQDIQGEWVLVLLAEDGLGHIYPFILPGSLVGHRTQIQITSHPDLYRGWMAQYLNRWDLIDYLAGEVYQDNGPLFDNWDSGEAVYPPPIVEEMANV